MVDVPSAVGVEGKSGIASVRGGLRALVVGIAVAGVLTVGEVQRSVAAQLVVEEYVRIEHTGGGTLVVLVGGTRVVNVVGVVGADVQRALASAQIEAGAHGCLVDVGIGFGLDAQRLTSGFGTDDDGARGQVAVFHRGYAADNFHRFDVFRRDAAHVGAAAGRSSSRQCGCRTGHGGVQRREVGVVRDGCPVADDGSAQPVQVFVGGDGTDLADVDLLRRVQAGIGRQTAGQQ